MLAFLDPRIPSIGPNEEPVRGLSRAVGHRTGITAAGTSAARGIGPTQTPSRRLFCEARLPRRCPVLSRLATTSRLILRRSAGRQSASGRMVARVELPEEHTRREHL